ncbi:unnamed protein product [Lactuca virosa]|uniref:Uncharacterized protein n=1 Tax=Lactuca virosa TaxID=75947 RepID=A0AAU9PP05_9ASTR|nr:unnamed protein product [Lactuca virosa]
MKPYKNRIFIFHIQGVINSMLLMPDTQILKGILLHTKVGMFDEAFNRAQQESYNPTGGDTGSEGHEEGPTTHRTDNDDSYMAAIRDIIAQDIMEL